MSYVDELLLTAEKLLDESDGNQPSRSDSNRAVSTAYYAIFHFLCAEVADRVTGLTDGTELVHTEWTEVFRSITHSSLSKALTSLKKDRYDVDGTNEFVSKTFGKLHSAREDADYNSLRTFEVAEARQLINEARVLSLMAFKKGWETSQEQANDDLTYLIRCLFSIKSKAATK